MSATAAKVDTTHQSDCSFKKACCRGICQGMSSAGRGKLASTGNSEKSMKAKGEFEGRRIAEGVAKQAEAEHILSTMRVRFYWLTIPVIGLAAVAIWELLDASELFGGLLLYLMAATGAVMSITAWVVCFRLNKRLDAVLALLKQRT